MPYLGRELTSGNYLKLDDISSQFNGSTTTFQLKSGGSDFFPGSSFSLLVSVAGVIQEADSAYQINNNEITFATAPSNGDDAFIIVLGVPEVVTEPLDATSSRLWTPPRCTRSCSGACCAHMPWTRRCTRTHTKARVRTQTTICPCAQFAVPHLPKPCA